MLKLKSGLGLNTKEALKRTKHISIIFNQNIMLDHCNQLILVNANSDLDLLEKIHFYNRHGFFNLY